jgi:hypothetical protein
MLCTHTLTNETHRVVTLSPYLTSHILRFGAYATDELHIPPEVFDPALDEVDFGGEQPAAA